MHRAVCGINAAAFPRPVTLQSAAIPYRIEPTGSVSVLLVTSRTRRRWILPKGKIGRGLDAAQSAGREALEEAGVTGRIVPDAIGRYRQPGRSVLGFVADVRIEAFALEVEAELVDWPERHQRERSWFTLASARRVVRDAQLRQVLRAFEQWIAAGKARQRAAHGR